MCSDQLLMFWYEVNFTGHSCITGRYPKKPRTLEEVKKPASMVGKPSHLECLLGKLLADPGGPNAPVN